MRRTALLPLLLALAGCPEFPVVECLADADCASGLRCDTAAGSCTACLTDSDCAPGRACTGAPAACACPLGIPGGAPPTGDTAELLLTLELEGDYANALELSKDGCTLFLSEWDRRRITRIDLGNGEALLPIRVDEPPHALFHSVGSDSLLIASDDRDAHGRLDRLPLSGPAAYLPVQASPDDLGYGLQGAISVLDPGGAERLFAISYDDSPVAAGAGKALRLVGDGAGGFVRDESFLANVTSPRGHLAAAPEGNLWIAGEGTSGPDTAPVLFELDPGSGTVTPHVLEPGPPAAGVALHPAGILFVGLVSGAVRRYSFDGLGSLRETDLQGAAGLPDSTLWDLVLAPSGDAVLALLADGAGKARVIVVR